LKKALDSLEVEPHVGIDLVFVGVGEWRGGITGVL
jgi:hypothetical protein